MILQMKNQLLKKQLLRNKIQILDLVQDQALILMLNQLQRKLLRLRKDLLAQDQAVQMMMMIKLQKKLNQKLKKLQQRVMSTMVNLNYLFKVFLLTLMKIV